MRITIVTPSLDQRAYLRETIDSVLSQTGAFDVVHRIVDGGSTDGTLDLLRSVGDPRLRWTSGPDRGQSDAVNTGLADADGEVIGWLNSDDTYLPGALAAVATAFADPAVQWVAGKYRVIDSGGRPVRQAVVRYKQRLLRRYTYRRLLRQNMIAQPAVFWRQSFGNRAGPLDPTLHYTMDYDLWLRMARLAPPTLLDRELAQFRVHPTSKTGRIDRRQFDEGYRVACRYFDGDRASRIAHRFHVEKIVWAYRLIQAVGR